MENNSNTLFDKEEETLLKKTRDIRFKLIDDMTEDQLPTRSGDIRVLNETLDAADRQLIDLAKLKAKQQETEGNNKTIAMVSELLGRVATGASMQQISNHAIDLPDDFIPIDIVPGEVETSPEELELGLFIKGDDNE